jgi:hypothetical protein
MMCRCREKEEERLLARRCSQSSRRLVFASTSPLCARLEETSLPARAGVSRLLGKEGICGMHTSVADTNPAPRTALSAASRHLRATNGMPPIASRNGGIGWAISAGDN